MPKSENAYYTKVIRRPYISTAVFHTHTTASNKQTQHTSSMAAVTIMDRIASLSPHALGA